jgi:hypothetical protein
MAVTRMVAWLGAGADLAHDPSVLQIGVGAFTGSALTGAGGVDRLVAAVPFGANRTDTSRPDPMWRGRGGAAPR